MSKSERTPSAGSFYPSPPASPRLTIHDTTVINRNIEFKKLGSLKTELLSNRQDFCTSTGRVRAQPPGSTYNIAPKLVEELKEATERLGEEVNRLAETVNRLELAIDELVLQTWKKTLLLHQGMCGVIYTKGKKAFLCETKIASWKTATIEQSIGVLKRSNQSALEMETQLNILARLSCCPAHLNPPFIWDRINKWLVAMPGGPYKATPERELRNKWTWKPNQCSYTTQQGTLCGTPMGPKCRANKYYCKRTIDEIVQLVTTPRYDGITLDYLLEVLHHHMRCHRHFECRPKPHSDWETAVASFKKAFWALRDYEPLRVNGHSARLRVNSRRPEKLASQYWNGGFDTSPFNVLRKGDICDTGMSPQETIRDVIKEILDNNQVKIGENEVNSGYVYIFTVPGNDGFVKIGFTGRDGNARHDEWDKSCNRQHAVVYTTKLILHAHRVEKLVHAELMEPRIRIYCELCRYQHIEWFEISKEVAIASVKKWALWIAGAPYEEKETGWNLKDDEAKKVEDMETFLKGLEDAAEAAGDAEQTAKSAATDSEK